MSPPLPPEIFDAAVAVYRRRERVDMQALAAEVGISRATLYRRAGSRARVLGEVVWFFTERILRRAVEDARGLTGAERVLEATRGFMRAVDAQPALRRFLEAEPECALKVLTAPDGRVHGAIVEAVVELLREEQEAGNLELAMNPETTAFLIVRIGEGFLYADVIADRERETDVDRALDVIGELLAVAQRSTLETAAH